MIIPCVFVQTSPFAYCLRQYQNSRDYKVISANAEHQHTVRSCYIVSTVRSETSRALVISRTKDWSPKPVLRRTQNLSPALVLSRTKDWSPKPLLRRTQNLSPALALSRTKDWSPKPVLRRTQNLSQHLCETEHKAGPQPLLVSYEAGTTSNHNLYCTEHKAGP